MTYHDIFSDEQPEIFTHNCMSYNEQQINVSLVHLCQRKRSFAVIVCLYCRCFRQHLQD